MSADLLIRRTGNLMESAIDDDLVALDIDQGSCFGFNAMAHRIWRMLDEPMHLSDLRERLLATYDVDPQTCDRDLRELLATLEENRLIMTAPLAA